jgi:adenylate cyclase
LVILLGTPIWLDGPLLDILIKTRALVVPQKAQTTESPVAVIALDVRSLQEPELAPYPRTLLAPVWATLLNSVVQAGVRAVGFDLVFVYSANRLSPDFDRPFLELLNRHRDLIVLGRSMTTLPAPPFLGALRFSPDALGVVDLPPDPDGSFRHVPRHFPSGQNDLPVPSMAAALWHRAQGEAFPHDLLLVPRQHLERIPTYAIVDVLRCATQAPGVLEHAFKDKILLVGSTLREEDRHLSSGRYLPAQFSDSLPIAPCGLRRLGASAPDSSTVPGVFLHAAALDAVLTGRIPATAPTPVMAAIAMVMATGVATASLTVAPWLALVISIGMVLAVLIIGAVLLEQNLWIPLALPLLALVAAFVVAFVIRYLVEERKKRAIQQELTFLGGLPPKMVEQIAMGNESLKLGGEEATITVMFADLSGFTKLSTQLSPHLLAARTTQYLACIVQEVEATGGWVNQLMGDCVMAIWGAPVADSNHAIQSVRAACAAVTRIDHVRAEGERRGERGFDVKVGLNSGQAIVGKIGTFMRGSYSACGQTVNVASRLERVPALYHCNIVIGPGTADLVQSRFLLRELDSIQVQGVDSAIRVFEPLGEQPGTPEQRELMTRYAEALGYYRARRFHEAMAQWETLACSRYETRHSQESQGKDGNPSAVMVERSRTFMVTPPAPSWNGTWMLTSK